MSKLIFQMERFFEKKSMKLSEARIKEAKRGQNKEFNYAKLKFVISLLKEALDRRPTLREISYVADLNEKTVRTHLQSSEFKNFVSDVTEKRASEEGWFRSGKKEIEEGVKIPILGRKRLGSPRKVGGDIVNAEPGRPDKMFELSDPKPVKSLEKSLGNLRDFIREYKNEDEEVRKIADYIKEEADKRKRAIRKELLDPELFKRVESIVACKWIEIYANQNIPEVLLDELKNIVERMKRLLDAGEVDMNHLEDVLPYGLLDFANIPDEHKSGAVDFVFEEWLEKFRKKGFEEKYEVPDTINCYQIFRSIGDQVFQVITGLHQSGTFDKYLG